MSLQSSKLLTLVRACASGILVFNAPLCLAGPGVIHYQGRITTGTASSPVTTTTEVTFSFWDSPVGGNLLHFGFAGGITQFPIDVTPDAKGNFATDIGLNPPDDPIEIEIFHQATAPWLDVQLHGESIAPRQRVTSTAYALNVLSKYGSSYLMTDVTSDSVNNGQNLISTYNHAKALAPHGQPLSATNRATVLVAPDNYDLKNSQLLLDTDFVDLVGLTSSRQNQYIFGTANGAGTGMLRQTANDVAIENLLVACIGGAGTPTELSTDPAAYFPDIATSATLIRNCEFQSDSAAYTMRLGVPYRGSFFDTTAGDYAFGYKSEASGTFLRCQAGELGFGTGGTASGNFTDCISATGSFGGNNGLASGNFTRCEGSLASFGGNNPSPGVGKATGVFRTCTGGSLAFGGGGEASGKFTDCVGSVTSFGGSQKASGTFVSCTAGASSFGGNDNGNGRFYYCSGGTNSFATTGTLAPVYDYCLRDGAPFP